MATHPAVASADSDDFEQRIRERELLRSGPLETIPGLKSAKHDGGIPNTPLAVSTISFLLGSIFALGFLTFLSGSFRNFWFTTYQLGFFVASWSVFHWGEFAVTAGWNREKVSVDCTHSYFWYPYPLTKSF
jgi:protein-S-isoprenylcysteine O-methyltransferase